MIKAIMELARFMDKHNFGSGDRPTVTLTFKSYDGFLRFDSALKQEQPYLFMNTLSTPGINDRIYGVEIVTEVKLGRQQ